MACAVAAMCAAIAVSSPRAVLADAGADLALSAYSGPIGSQVELSSADVFGMGADACPDVEGSRTWDDGDEFEIRWELGRLPDGVVGQPLAGGSEIRFTTLGEHEAEALVTGSETTSPGEPWSATITVPVGLEPGDRLVVNATCWHMGSGAEGGEAAWLNYYYLPVFTVTDVDGTIPAAAPSTDPSGSTVGSVDPPAAGAAVAQPGSPSLTG